MSDNRKTDKHPSMDRQDFGELVLAIKAILDIRDRSYGIPPKTYRQCFVGEQAVAILVQNGLAEDQTDAVRIMKILQEAAIIHHVLDEHDFKNEYLFYRFRDQEDHGKVARRDDGKKISWTDFLPSMGFGQTDRLNLQAALPERDPDLARFKQVDLDTCGVSPLDEHNAQLLDAVHPKKWIDPRAKSTYNLVVIGAGAGGLVSAAGAAGVGARVALIESHLLGGDCLNVGCVPSKALLASAKAAAVVRNAAAYGIKIEGAVRVDFELVMERLRRLRAQIAPVDSARRFSEELGVDVFMGRGRFTGKNTIEVNGQTLHFAKGVVATGGTAAIPDIPGLDQAPYLTNATIFNLTQCPARLGIIGAGPIGMELAQAFARLGSAVTVFSRSQKILPKEDPDAARLVQKTLAQEGVVFEFNARYKRVETNPDTARIRVVLDQGRQEHNLDFDSLLIATGRKPAVSGMGLKKAGIDYDARLGVTVNDRLQTTNPNVYAVGDVASRYQFTHMADFMARLVIRNALFFGRDQVSSLLIPWATYTDPEVAHVGLYEKDLQEQKIAYETFRRDFDDVDRRIVDGDTKGFVKIHVKTGGDQILGATIVGSHAGDMISEITLAMQGGMGLGKLAGVIHPYPTAAEAIRQCGDAFNRGRLTPVVKRIFNRLMALKR